MDMFKKILIIFFVALCCIAAGIILTSPHTTPPHVSSKVSVYTSFYPLYEFTTQVGKEYVDVHNLTPAGVEPHDFEPTAKDIAGIENSSLLITNGAGFEHWITNLPKDVLTHTTLVNTSQSIDLLSTGEFTDPHIWLDPNLAIVQVDTIQKALSRIDPQHATAYEHNAAQYIDQLRQLDQEFRTSLSACDTRTIVTSHDAFSYLAKRYNFDVLSLSGMSPDQEPSAAKLAEIAQLVRAKQIRYIFFESLMSPKLSEVIAHETGAQTLLFNPIEGLTEQEQHQGKSYIGIQKENSNALHKALSCH